MREAGRALIERWRALKTRELELLRELADLNVDPGARREYLIARENEANRLQGRAARATLDAEKRRIAETPVATGDALLANTRAIGHVTVESRESYIRRKMAENGWDRQTAIAQATHLYPEEMDDLRAPWANRQLYTGEGGHSPDTAAQALHDEGRISEPTVDAFWDAVRGDIETIGKAKRRELDAAEAEAAAALAWGKERHDQTLADIEMQDDAVGLGLGEARSSISGRRSTANVGNDVLTTLEDLDIGKDVFFDLKGRGRLRVTLGQDGPGGFGIMHIVEGRMLKDGQDLDGAIRTVLRVVEAATHGKFLRHKQGRDNYGKDGAIAVIAYEKAKADGTPGKGDFVLTGYEEFTSDAERKRADARAAALRRAGRYALPPHARSEEVVAALHRIIANIQNARKSDSARSAIGVQDSLFPDWQEYEQGARQGDLARVDAAYENAIKRGDTAIARAIQVDWADRNGYYLFAPDDERFGTFYIRKGLAPKMEHDKWDLWAYNLGWHLAERYNYGDTFGSRDLEELMYDDTKYTFNGITSTVEEWIRPRHDDPAMAADDDSSAMYYFHRGLEHADLPWLVFAKRIWEPVGASENGREQTFEKGTSVLGVYRDGEYDTGLQNGMYELFTNGKKFIITGVWRHRGYGGDGEYLLNRARTLSDNLGDIKSGDLVTYDDKGNAIPLSQRFDHGNPDIRSSIGGLYSGGPTAYGRPSLRAIGTNDAGRAYGWGLYATTERDMAEGYAGATWRELANAFRFGGKTYAELTQGDPEAARLIEGYTATAIAEKRARGYDPEALKRDLQRDRAWLADYLADPENAPENMDAYPQSKQDRLRRFQTRLQNVERLLQADIAMTERGIPAVHEQLWWTNRPDGDESHLLTWDARISEENRKRVIEAVRSLGLTDAQLAEHFGAKWDSTPMTGEQAYGFVTEAIRDLAKLEGDHEALASQLLARHDVDGTVRHFPAGGSIYVAFSDEHLQVVNRWIWDEETQAFVKDESFDRNAPEARSSIGGIFTGARMPYDRADSRFIGSGTGGQNEGFGHYGSGVRGVAQGKYASAYIPKKPKTWAQLPVNGDKRFPTLGKLGRICKAWTRVMPAEEENAWMFFAALANDAVSGKLPKGNVKAALKQAIRDELERERQAAEAYHAWRDATIPALLRGEQAERKTRRQEAAEARAASAYETYIKLGFDKDEVLDERLDELLDVPVNIPAVMEQVWFTNRPEGDLSHLLNWLEPVPEEQKRWIKRAFERRHGDAETRSIVDDALAEEKITGRDLYEALRQFYWGTLRDTGMVTTEDLIQSEVAQFLLSADIDGTRYPVDYRKGVTDGSHGWNYVAFSDEHMRVVRRWVWNEETETFELDRSFTPPTPTMAEARASISGRRLSKKKPIEAMTYGARVGVFREAQKRPSNGSGIDEKRFVHVADLPPWAEELGLSPQLMANGRVLRKLAKKHNINARAFAKLIEAIERPVAAFIETPEKNIGGRRRQRQSDAIVLILEEHIPDRSGAPAPSSVVVLANYEGYTHLITAYGMDPKVETKYVGAVNNGLMQWVDKERAKKLPLLAATALALDSFNGASGPSTRTIAKPGAEVNTEVDPQTTSAWQKDAHGIYPDASGDLSRSSIAGSTAIPSTKFTIAEARQAIRDQNEKNPKGYTNRETGNVAFINSTQMREMTNPNALGKSKENGFSNWEHLHAVALAPTLYENATLVRDDPDTKHGDPHVRIMRYAADIVIDRAEGLVQAKAWLTVKTSEQRGHRVYSLELLELTDARLITEDTASTALPRARDITRTIANPAGEVNIENAPRSRRVVPQEAEAPALRGGTARGHGATRAGLRRGRPRDGGGARPQARPAQRLHLRGVARHERLRPHQPRRAGVRREQGQQDLDRREQCPGSHPEARRPRQDGHRERLQHRLHQRVHRQEQEKEAGLLADSVRTDLERGHASNRSGEREHRLRLAREGRGQRRHRHRGRRGTEGSRQGKKKSQKERKLANPGRRKKFRANTENRRVRF